MKYIIQLKSYKDIDNTTKNKIKNEKLILICYTSEVIDHPKGFNIIVFDKNDEIKAKFISLEDAIEYAEYLSNK